MNKRILSVALASLMLAPTASMAQKKGQPTMKETIGKHFLIGCALNTDYAAEKNPQATKAITENFNSIVAENCMKGEVIHPEEDRYDWTSGDSLITFAERHNMTAIGHCLVWHSQPPKWMFTDKEGKTVSREVLIDRMYHHITNVVSHYKGKIKGWDVVNEAIEDDGSFRQSPYYKIIGPDFIELAFKFAHAADPDVELYYNDYSMNKPGKRAAVVKLIKDLKAKGCRIDAVGMQSHNGFDYPDLTEYEQSIQAYIAAGVKVQFTELDLNVLPQPWQFNGAGIEQHFAAGDPKMDPYVKGMPKKIQKQYNERWLSFFKLYKKYEKDIERVTLWGVDDGTSWLNDWPISGRTNYGMLIDRNFKLKPVVKDIIKLFQEEK